MTEDQGTALIAAVTAFTAQQHTDAIVLASWLGFACLFLAACAFFLAAIWSQEVQ